MKREDKYLIDHKRLAQLASKSANCLFDKRAPFRFTALRLQKAFSATNAKAVADYLGVDVSEFGELFTPEQQVQECLRLKDLLKSLMQEINESFRAERKLNAEIQLLIFKTFGTQLEDLKQHTTELHDKAEKIAERLKAFGGKIPAIKNAQGGSVNGDAWWYLPDALGHFAASRSLVVNLAKEKYAKRGLTIRQARDSMNIGGDKNFLDRTDSNVVELAEILDVYIKKGFGDLYLLEVLPNLI